MLMQINITLNNQCNFNAPFSIVNWVQEVCKHLDLSIEHIEVTLLTTHDIQKMNSQYFKNDVGTDTITFNLDSHENIIGDIYLCPEVIHNNSDTWGTSLEKEFKLVIIHSILHLIGYTDDSVHTNEIMEKKQTKIYNELTKIK